MVTLESHLLWTTLVKNIMTHVVSNNMTLWSDPFKSMITDTEFRTLIVKRWKMNTLFQISGRGRTLQVHCSSGGEDTTPTPHEYDVTLVIHPKRAWQAATQVTHGRCKV